MVGASRLKGKQGRILRELSYLILRRPSSQLCAATCPECAMGWRTFSAGGTSQESPGAYPPLWSRSARPQYSIGDELSGVHCPQSKLDSEDRFVLTVISWECAEECFGICGSTVRFHSRFCHPGPSNTFSAILPSPWTLEHISR